MEAAKSTEPAETNVRLEIVWCMKASVFGCCELSGEQSLPRDYIEDCAKTDEERSVVNGDARTGEGRKIFGEEAVGHPCRNQEE